MLFYAVIRISHSLKGTDMNALQTIGPVTGRLLIAFIFIMAGWGKIGGLEGTVGYIASAGLPLPSVAAIVASAVELGGGLLIAVGYKARWAAAARALFTLVTALAFHAFWALPADQAQNQMIHFMKNLAIMGGLLYVVVHGSGPLSQERRARPHPRESTPNS